MIFFSPKLVSVLEFWTLSENEKRYLIQGDLDSGWCNWFGIFVEIFVEIFDVLAGLNWVRSGWWNLFEFNFERSIDNWQGISPLWYIAILIQFNLIKIYLVVKSLQRNVIITLLHLPLYNQHMFVFHCSMDLFIWWGCRLFYSPFVSFMTAFNYNFSNLLNILNWHFLSLLFSCKWMNWLKTNC